MQTDCIPDLFGFVAVEGRPVVATFDGGSITSDAGALLLGATDRAIGLIDRFAACFCDARRPELIEHEVETLVGQRVFGLALGYEDLIDHDELRHDPVMAILAGKLEARREDCAPVAGKSTLNRLELSRPLPTRYHKISHDAAGIETLLVDLLVEAHRAPPKQIILDLDDHRPTRWTAIRKAASSTAITTATVIYPLRVLRPPPVGGQASQGQHRRERRGGGGNRPHRGAAARQLAQCAHLAARRFGLRPRGLDGLVRSQPGGLPLRPGAQCPPRCDDRERACRGQERGGGEQKAGAPLQGVPVVDAR